MKSKSSSEYSRTVRRKGKLLGKKVCDRLWSSIIRARLESKACELCGETKYRLNAHHLISRQSLKYRWDLNNGISICGKCHKWGITAVHVSPWFLEQALKEKKPEQYNWWISNRFDVFDQGMPDYSTIFLYLLNEYRKVTDKVIITMQDEKEIVAEYMVGDISCRALAKKHKVNGHTIIAILKRANVEVMNRLSRVKLSLTGKKRPSEVGQKVSKSKMGGIPWNKGIPGSTRKKKEKLEETVINNLKERIQHVKENSKNNNN